MNGVVIYFGVVIELVVIELVVGRLVWWIKRSIQAAPIVPVVVVVSVDAEFFCIGTQESDRRFAVVNVSRENRFAAQAIINGRRDVALGRKSLSDIGMMDLAAFSPTAAMNREDFPAPRCRE